MAWIILWANGEELSRAELARPVVIGRSSDCDMPVRDLLMSRVHCRLEPIGRGWRVVDLGSRNGTRVGWQKVQTHLLRDGDWLRAGRTRVSFHTGPFEPHLAQRPSSDRMVRPADPHEALSGTVTDFVLLDEEDNPRAQGDDALAFPSPKPRPLDPDSISEPAVQSLLHALASSQHEPDSAGGTATLTRTAPCVRPLPRVKPRTVFRAVPGVADDLAAQHDLVPLPAAIPPRPARSLQNRILTAVGIALATCIGTAIVVMSAWLLTLAP